MKWLPILFLISITPPSVVTWKALYKIEKPYDHFTTDHLQQMYLVKGNELTMFDAKNMLLHSYSETRFGEIGRVDATNPFKVLVSYPMYNTVLVLDNRLTRLAAWDLAQAGYNNVEAYGAARDQGMWIYDGNSFQLIKLDENLSVLQKSQPLNQFGSAPKPMAIIERDNWVYMQDSTLGIMVFDNYGTYYKNIPVYSSEKISILKKELLYLTNGELRSFNIETLTDQKISIPDNPPIHRFSAQKDRLYIDTGMGLIVYESS